uniref:Uncharacterized protein n=1 Tax=Cacopsylla melanoneura TaxID=428564 RepID=A0A8D8XCX4_9HEMI
MNSTLEPTGIFCQDGKRPDGMTIIPWIRGQNLVWDVTCVDTFAQCYLRNTTEHAGAAAEIACKKKEKKYEGLTSQYLFCGMVVETMGPFGKSFKKIVDEIAEKMSAGDVRSYYICVSVA